MEDLVPIAFLRQYLCQKIAGLRRLRISPQDGFGFSFSF
jgi:hypothetical protein